MYKPNLETAYLLDQAMDHINSVPYDVTARWLFYRLLQDGLLDKKSDYKRLLGYLSKARKGFWGRWTPSTLADDTRAALIRGDGHETPDQWLEAMISGVVCNVDHWATQSTYVEVWFEASAMASQFDFYVNPNISLLAFHGDVSIPEKWRCAQRLRRRYDELNVPIVVLYYGDLDDKGLLIPISAVRDIRNFIAQGYADDGWTMWREKYDAFDENFEFIRVGLNDDHIQQYGVTENPERPGTYQWEALSDVGAQELIAIANDYMDPDALDEIEGIEEETARQVRGHLEELRGRLNH